MEEDDLIAQVKLNCNISDAKSWGFYSICGLLLRLRELYRSEHSLMPWDAIPQTEISEWIGSREKDWERLGEDDLHEMEIDERRYDPFAVHEINIALKSHGLLYGGGYGMFHKPTFFLALRSDERELYDYHIYYAGRELCRDISASVAMLQGRCIFIRQEQINLLLWEKLAESKARRFRGFLEEAFSSYGVERREELSGALQEKIRTISRDITDLFLFHEIGEAFEDDRSEEWLSILDTTQDKWTEIYLRGIKDLLADTSEKGPLQFIMNRKNVGLMNFYMALILGIRKELFPEMIDAFGRFTVNGDWSLIEEARSEGYRKASGLKSEILSLAGGRTEIIKDYLKTRKKGGWR
ncbi:MAG TPA: hypothetical protein VFG09_08390 [Thermodesulfovibrionales bacterium]|nr:hypothetical protein [Thermodesulfovibrionales bacterium]